MQTVEAELGHPPPAGWFERGEQALRQRFEAELEPVPGIVEALERISLPACVASSSPPEQLRFKLELTGLYERFAGRIFSASEVANGKPAPDLFLHAAARMGAAPDSCVVVEDSRYGVQAARAAGMDVLGYAGGVTPAEALAGPRTVVFDDMRSLPELLCDHDARPYRATRDADRPRPGRARPPRLHQPRPRRRPGAATPTWRRWSARRTPCSTRHTPAACATSTPPAPTARPRRSWPAGSTRAGWVATRSRSARSGATRTPRSWRIDAEVHEVKDLTAATFRRQLAETRELLGDHLRLYQIHSATLESGVLDDREVLDELARLRASGVFIGLTTSGPEQAADDRAGARGRRLRLGAVDLEPARALGGPGAGRRARRRPRRAHQGGARQRPADRSGRRAGADNGGA